MILTSQHSNSCRTPLQYWDLVVLDTQEQADPLDIFFLENTLHGIRFSVQNFLLTVKTRIKYHRGSASNCRGNVCV